PSHSPPSFPTRRSSDLMAVNSIIHSKTFDYGMICASEQSVTVLESVYEAAKAEFLRRGCYFLKPDELDKVRSTILINGALNAKIDRKSTRLNSSHVSIS